MIELTAWEKRNDSINRYGLLLNISNVCSAYVKDGVCRVRTVDNLEYQIEDESFRKLCDAMRDFYEDENTDDGSTIGNLRSRVMQLERSREIKSVADKLCELQNDLTWVRQGFGNLLHMFRDSTFKTAIMLGCADNDLESLFETVYEEALNMQKRIKELEDEIKIMQEPKMKLNV